LAGSVIRFAPPMCITQADADFMLEVFDAAFASLTTPSVPKPHPALATA